MSDLPPRLHAQAIPPEIRRWNWGAFLLNWIWGIGNNTFIALLALIPGLGFIMMIVLGAKGNVWAWRNGRWDSVDHFRRVQRRWAIWGFVIWIGAAVFFGAVIGGAFSLLRYSDAYKMAAAELQANPVATSVLGSPIAAGLPNGSISVQGSSSGNAELTFTASGPKAAGTVLALAVKRNGVWSLTRLTLTPDGGKAIDLIGGAKPNTT